MFDVRIYLIDLGSLTWLEMFLARFRAVGVVMNAELSM